MADTVDIPLAGRSTEDLCYFCRCPKAVGEHVIWLDSLKQIGCRVPMLTDNRKYLGTITSDCP